MDSISISAASGMRARMESLEMLANNLANTDTGGFKADREFYSLYTSPDASVDPQTGVPSTLPVVEKHWTDHAQGDFRVTNNPLDFAIEGDGMFAIQTPRGPRYTRNGSFRIAPGGVMTTLDGNEVMAVGGGKIQLQPELPFNVEMDGSVVQSGQTLGRMDIVTFDPSVINKEGTNYYAPASGAKPSVAKGTVLQGKLEASNVGPAESAVRLVAIMRQFDMLQRAMSIGNELNKRAIEEVARVAN